MLLKDSLPMIAEQMLPIQKASYKDYDSTKPGCCQLDILHREKSVIHQRTFRQIGQAAVDHGEHMGPVHELRAQILLGHAGPLQREQKSYVRAHRRVVRVSFLSLEC
jgi:hypothetical protein